jgi:hypothetical protein
MPTTRPSNVSHFGSLALLALASFLLGAIPGWGAPTITIGKKGLVAQGITPGGRAIWWSVAHEHPDSFVTIVHRLEEQTDADLDGIVLFEHEGELPDASIWVAVDVTTGTYGSFAPVDFGVTETSLPPESAQTGVAGRDPADAFLEMAHPMIDVLLVRAAQGAWDLRVGDGGDADQDGGIEGEISFPIDGMAPIGASPAAPARYADGDLLLSIDIDDLELSSLVVSSPPPPPPPGIAVIRAGVRR